MKVNMNMSIRIKVKVKLSLNQHMPPRSAHQIRQHRELDMTPLPKDPPGVGRERKGYIPPPGLSRIDQDWT